MRRRVAVASRAVCRLFRRLGIETLVDPCVYWTCSHADFRSFGAVDALWLTLCRGRAKNAGLRKAQAIHTHTHCILTSGNKLMSDEMRFDKCNENQRYTYADYLTWECRERYEIFNGEAIMMASPSVAHQALQVGLISKFDNWLQGKTCKVFGSPLDVRLFPKNDNSDNTVVQPDVLVVCDQNKLGKKSVDGPPDLIIEIVSPSNINSELMRKFHYCLKAGVREYWVIDPELKTVSVHVYNGGHYISTSFEDNDRIPVTILPGSEISLEELWARLNGA